MDNEHIVNCIGCLVKNEEIKKFKNSFRIIKEEHAAFIKSLVAKDKKIEELKRRIENLKTDLEIDVELHKSDLIRIKNLQVENENLKQNQFEVIAEGVYGGLVGGNNSIMIELTDNKTFELKDEWFGKNIQIGVKIIEEKTKQKNTKEKSR